MHSLEPELRALHAEGAIDDATAARALARDRGRVFPVHGELRALLYGGVLLVTTGVGLVLARNLERIGPVAILLGIALAAAICAVPAVRARHAGRPLSVAADYLLLLAMLLVSAGLGYAEHEFQLLGPLWSWHLLLLAALHAAVACAFSSSLVLAAALAALAGWFGVGGTLADPLHVASLSTPALGSRALACAAVIATWSYVDHRRANHDAGFDAVFEHFAANLAFWGAIAWCLEWPWLAAGMPLVAALAFVTIRRGFATGREMLLVYGVVYPAIGLCTLVVPRLHDETMEVAFILAVVGAAAFALLHLRRRLREPHA